MLRLKDLPPEEMAEVVRVASELQQRDQRANDDQRERQHVVDAAEEVGLPAEYLEQAAAEIHQRRVADTIARRRRKSWALGASLVGGSVLLGLIFTGTQSARRASLQATPPQSIESFSADPELRWKLNQNPATQSSVRFAEEAQRGGVAVIRVDRFGRSADGKFWANLDLTQGGTDLTGRKSVSFDVRGKGLPQLRLYLENGALERWRSPALTVPGTWAKRSVRLDQFDYQTRKSSSDSWSVNRYQPPKQVRELSFKLGDFVNPVSAKGEVALDNVVAE